jgi:hypothetical protein
VVAKLRERLAVSKQTVHRVHMERFILKKLSEVEGKERYRVEVSNRFAASEDLDTEVDINPSAWRFKFRRRVSPVVLFSAFLLKLLQKKDNIVAYYCILPERTACSWLHTESM